MVGRAPTLLDQAQHKCVSTAPRHSTRAVHKGGLKKVRNANRNERSRGYSSLLHGQDMGKTQNHRWSIEQRLAVGGWRLAAGGGWQRMSVGS